jgi:dihydrofolate reductase
MRRLTVFNQVSVDGYFRTPGGDIRWLHEPRDDDEEFRQFTIENTSGGGALLFGRATYDQMASFWPTPAAARQFPEVAREMNRRPKFVVSKTLRSPEWQNTTVLSGDLVSAITRLKSTSGEPITILGSGTIVTQLTQAALIDEYQVLVIPVVLGEGVTMFDGVTTMMNLTLTASRAFRNGRAFHVYVPKA